MEKNLDTTKPLYSEHILPVLGPSLYQGSTVIISKLIEIYCISLKKGSVIGLQEFIHYLFNSEFFFTKARNFLNSAIGRKLPKDELIKR